ncbi:MAG: hypothetical protein AAB963_01045 [Patescibacteria group bacterium]
MFQKLLNPFKYQFSVNSDDLYSISISAVCKKKNYLRVEIDGVALKGILPKSRNEFFNIPSSWNGNELKNIAKTVVFVIKLSKGNHNLNFIPRGQAEIILEPTITKLNNAGLITILKDVQSEERNCQPWITVALIDISILVLDISASCQKRFLDSDDVKLIIDGKIQKNAKSILRGKNWFWRGWQLKGKTQISRFDLNFPSGVHFIELWADRTPMLGSLELEVGGERTGVGGYKNRDLGWWKKSKPVKAYTYPPEEPLDPNLVKAMIFQESRVGNDSDGKLNIMQVGNPGDPSLDVLNNASKKPENELKNGELWQVDYSGMAKVNTVYDSIYWGVRWLYHRAQWIGNDNKRYWFPWKEAVKRYGPGTSEYVENVFNIYLDGVDKRRGESPIKLWLFLFFLFSSVFFSVLQYHKYSIKIAVLDTFTQEQRVYINDVDIKTKWPGGNLFLATIERDKDWWEDLKVGKYINGRIEWLRFPEEIVEQSVLAVGFSRLKIFLRPGIWVYGETHMGHGNFYVFTIENSNLKLSLKTPAVDYNPDIRWSPDNLKKYGYGQCGEIIRGGKLSHYLKYVDGDNIPEVVLSGMEDIICENVLDDKIEEIRVASNPIYKIFYLPKHLSLK